MGKSDIPATDTTLASSPYTSGVRAESIMGLKLDICYKCTDQLIEVSSRSPNVHSYLLITTYPRFVRFWIPCQNVGTNWCLIWWISSRTDKAAERFTVVWLRFCDCVMLPRNSTHTHYVNNLVVGETRQQPFLSDNALDFTCIFCGSIMG